MRKYIIGGLIGFCLSFAVGANAEVINMIGKVVENEFDLTINNQKMEYKAIAIDGTTYAPVRMLGEATGHIVKFDTEKGVMLIKKITTPKETVLKSIAALRSTISTNENMINGNKTEIERLKKGAQTHQVLIDIKTAEDTIERLQKGVVGLNEQIDKLNKTLADIESQEAELSK